VVSFPQVSPVCPLLIVYQRISPSLRSCEMFCNVVIFNGEELLAPRSAPPSWRITPFRLSAIAYSVYLQLPSIYGGHSSIHNLRKCHSLVTGQLTTE
jgi:hypothetical protein